MSCEYDFQYKDGVSRECKEGYGIRYCVHESAVEKGICDHCLVNTFWNKDKTKCVFVGDFSTKFCAQYNFDGAGDTCGYCRDCLKCKLTYYMKNPEECTQGVLKGT